MRAVLGITIGFTGVEAVMVDADVPELGPFDTLRLAVGTSPLDVAHTAVHVMADRARRVGVSLLAAGITTDREYRSKTLDLESVAETVRRACPTGVVVLTTVSPGPGSVGAVSGVDTATSTALLAAVGTEQDEPPRHGGRALLAPGLVMLAVFIAGALLAWALWQGTSGPTRTGLPAAPDPSPSAPAPPAADCTPHGQGSIRIQPGTVLGVSAPDPSSTPHAGNEPDPRDPCLRPA